MRMDRRLVLWDGPQLNLFSHELLGIPERDEGSDIIAIKTGGHFPGSSVLWWKSARKLLVADSIMIVRSGVYHVDRPPNTISFTFMWSYPNMVSCHFSFVLNHVPKSVIMANLGL
jgi:glyoxylase-like metal-dependent hydrolase (beta-lactamase superfamily II)